jgi:glucose/mannose-6-phosphate isomerase
MLQSKFTHPRNRIRENITLQILQRRRINSESILLEPSPTPLAELLEAILLGDYVSYYLAIINNIAPNPVEIIDFLKDKLAEHPKE